MSELGTRIPQKLFKHTVGIFTGANMSGDLKNAQRDIPRGTIAAQLTTSFVSILLVIMFGSTIIGPVLADKLVFD